jgi:protein O-GlcNAc transferase
MNFPNRNAPCPCGSGKKYKQCCLKRDEMLAAERRAGAASVAKMLQAALTHHQAGRLPDAETLYRHIVKVEPDHADALHLLGVIASQRGQHETAAELMGHAVRIKPGGVACTHLGNALLGLGRLGEAADSYRQAIALQPDYAEAHYNLGVVLQNQGEPDEAVASYCRAIALAPDYAEAHNNLGGEFLRQGRQDDAIEHFRRALASKPDYADAHNNLGNALQTQGKLSEAIEHFRRALASKPDYAEVHNNLGNALQAQGKLDAAAECYQKALAFKPDFAEAHSNLGSVFKKQGRLDEAILHCGRAIALTPGFAEGYCNMGNALRAQGRLSDAAGAYRQALAFQPDFAEAHNNLAILLTRQGRPGEAVSHCWQALAINPHLVEAHDNLGNALTDLGELDEAIENYRAALTLAPGGAFYYANMLFCMNYHPDLSAQEICRAYQEYDRQQCLPLRSVWRAHDNDRDANRRLRVGYVSPDFRQHSVRLFLEPLLARHDKAEVEVYAYAELFTEDDMSRRYRSYADHWIPTKGMSDEALSERIRSDSIDILVELAGHTEDNRLLTFARKPAPISVSWLGYGYTTGLSAIDYYLTDEVCAPQGCEALFAEKPWRVATPAYVYRPAAGMGEVGSLPALQRGYVTFGTLTRSVRINHRTIRVWSEILKAVPNSRLVIDSSNFREGTMQELMEARFAEHGIERERLSIGFHTPPWDVLRGMDIGLDCFPHNSGTTLFETLYMGVPYITLAGRPSVGRLGGSILHGVGHPEWIATSEDDYIARAVELASDIPRLAGVRATLRGQMQACPLMDEAGFARKVEGAYRGMWKAWCEKGDAA